MNPKLIFVAGVICGIAIVIGGGLLFLRRLEDVQHRAHGEDGD